MPSYSHNTTLLLIQLLCEVWGIGCKALLLSQYNAVAYSIALRGRENWWQGLPTLTVQRCRTLNCSARSEKLVARLTYNCCSHATTLFHTQLLFKVREIGGKPCLLTRYNVVAYSLNCFAGSGKLVARPTCSHEITLLLN